MEDGSLLQEALQFMSQQRALGAGSNEDYLVIHAFLLGDGGNDNSSGLVDLDVYSNTCNQINEVFAEQTLKDKYLWDDGSSSGPIFGFDVIGNDNQTQVSKKKPFGYDGRTIEGFEDCNHSIRKRKNEQQNFPCLKSLYRYNNSIDDIWYIVGIILNLTSRFPYIAFEILEGPRNDQVLLVEAANVLPSWADNAGPDGCGHRVWLVRGKCCLIAPRSAYYIPNSPSLQHSEPTQSLGLGNALGYLRYAVASNDDNDINRSDFTSTKEYTQLLIETPSAVQEAIRRRVLKIDHVTRYHRASVALPIDIASILCRDQTIVPNIVHAFIENPRRFTTKWNPKSLEKKSDLVIIVIRFTKVCYTALTGFAEDYPHKESFENMCNYDEIMNTVTNEEMTYLKRSVDIGACLCDGWNALFSTVHMKEPEYTPDTLNSSEWKRLSYLLNIPIPVETTSLCLTFSATRAKSTEFFVVNNILQVLDDNLTRCDTGTKIDFPLPSRDEIDDEKWLDVTSTDFENLMNNVCQDESDFDPNSFLVKSMQPTETEMKEISNMMKGFNSFLNEFSGVEGVEHERNEKKIAPKNLQEVNIDTSKFLNILNGTFHDLRDNDDIFSDDDDSNDELDTDDVIPNVSSVRNEVADIMRQMDEELRGTNVDHYIPDDNYTHNDHFDDANIDVHVLSNLLNSLDVEEGDSGPVSNILRGMSMSIPQGSLFDNENDLKERTS